MPTTTDTEIIFMVREDEIDGGPELIRLHDSRGIQID